MTVDLCHTGGLFVCKSVHAEWPSIQEVQRLNPLLLISRFIIKPCYPRGNILHCTLVKGADGLLCIFLRGGVRSRRMM